MFLQIMVSTYRKASSWRLQSLTGTVRSNFSKCNDVRGTQQIFHMEQSSRSQILEVFRMHTHSNSPGTNQNCLWMGSGFTINITPPVTFTSSRGRTIPDSVCLSTSSTDFQTTFSIYEHTCGQGENGYRMLHVV